METKKFAKDDTEIYKIRREKVEEELEQIIPNKSKGDSLIELNISEMPSDSKIEYYKAGDKVKIYDINGTGNFVDILWPKNATVKVLNSLISEKLQIDQK